jgi:hypothetical protein
MLIYYGNKGYIFVMIFKESNKKLTIFSKLNFKIKITKSCILIIEPQTLAFLVFLLWTDA